MLTREENEFLTRIGPGTPMGNLIRQYWIPFLISTELPQPDGPQLRVRLLGEDLIAFRTTSGQVGLVAQGCLHRGASLFFGRNEEHGIRCAYHGWKFDLIGACVEMPNESQECQFKEKVRLDAMIIQTRRKLIKAAGELMENGTIPPGVEQPDLYRVRPVGAVLPPDADWLAETEERRRKF